MASSNVESIYISSHRSNFTSYLTTSFEVAVAVQAFLPCTTSTWSSLQKLWHLFIICMKLIEAPNLFMRRKLNFVHFMCFFTLILLVNQWLVPTLFCCWNFFCPFLLEQPSSDLNLWNIAITLINRGSHFLCGFVTCLFLSLSQKKCGLLAKLCGNKQIFKYSIFLRLSAYSKLGCYSS